MNRMEEEKEGEKSERRNVRDIIRNFEMLKKDEPEQNNRKEKFSGNLGPIQKDGKEGGTSEGNAQKTKGEEGRIPVPNDLPKPKNVARLLRQHQVTSFSLPEESDGVAPALRVSLTHTNQPSAIVSSTAQFNAIHNHDNPVSSKLHTTMTLESDHSSSNDATTTTTVSNNNKPPVSDRNGASFNRPTSKPIPMVSKVHCTSPLQHCQSNSLSSTQSDSSRTGSPDLRTHRDIPTIRSDRHKQPIKVDCDLKLNLRSDTDSDPNAASNSSEELKLMLSPRTKFFVDTATQFRVSFEEEKLDTSEPANILRKKLLSSGVGRPRPRSLPPGDLQFFPKSASLDPNWAPRPLRRMMVLHESCAYQFPVESSPHTPCVPQTPLVPLPCGPIEGDNSSMESLDGAQTQNRKTKGFKRSISTDSGLSLGAVHHFKVKYKCKSVKSTTLSILCEVSRNIKICR